MRFFLFISLFVLTTFFQARLSLNFRYKRPVGNYDISFCLSYRESLTSSLIFQPILFKNINSCSTNLILKFLYQVLIELKLEKLFQLAALHKNGNHVIVYSKFPLFCTDGTGHTLFLSDLSDILSFKVYFNCFSKYFDFWGHYFVSQFISPIFIWVFFFNKLINWRAWYFKVWSHNLWI